MNDITELQIRLELALEDNRHLHETHAKDRTELAEWKNGTRRRFYRTYYNKELCQYEEFGYLDEARNASFPVYRVTVRPKVKP